jgi:nucleoside diphosphate kinase
MNERTLVFVKPRNENIAQEVFDYLSGMLEQDIDYYARSRINRVNPIPEALIEEHYRNLKAFDEELFRAHMEVFRTGTIFLASYSGERIISRVRLNIGNLDPLKAEPWTIRGKFSRESAEEALREKRYHNNVIHASSDNSEATRELTLWKDYILD